MTLAHAATACEVIAPGWSESWLAGQLSPNTTRAYTADIRQFVAFIGHRDLAAVRRTDLLRYLQLLTGKVDVGDYSPKTVNRKLSAVRQLFAEAVRHELIDRSPADGIRGYKSEGNFSPTKAPAVEQVIALLDSLDTDALQDVRDRAILYVMFGMGLRREEVADLRASDLSEHEGQAVLDALGKGSKRRRQAVPHTVLAAVRRWQAMTGIVDYDALFQPFPLNGECRPTGSSLTPNGLYDIVMRRFRAAGWTDCSPHSARHFFITYVIKHGASIFQAQQMAGHADPRTTERYIRSSDDLANSAAKFIDF